MVASVSRARVARRGAQNNALLVVAHPGHELRLFGWMRAARPDVLVLTDGSGSDGCSRLASTQCVLEKAGANAGALFGRYTDKRIYIALLAHDEDFFVDIAFAIAELLLTRRYSQVVADPLEGYNPTHDICRVVVDAAVRFVAVRSSMRIRNYDYGLINPLRPPQPAADWIRVHLPPDLVAHKVAAALAYDELASEVTETLCAENVRSLHEEWLRPVNPHAADAAQPPDDPPLYEQFGEQRLSTGRYSQVIRYREHFVPIVEALARFASPPAARMSSTSAGRNPADISCSAE